MIAIAQKAAQHIEKLHWDRVSMWDPLPFTTYIDDDIVFNYVMDMHRRWAIAAEAAGRYPVWPDVLGPTSPFR